MFNLFFKNYIIHNLEYDLISECKNIEYAKQYAYLNGYNIIVHFKNENIFWMNKNNIEIKFKITETNNVCDTYLIYEDVEKYNNFIVNQEIKNNNNKKLLILFGSLKNFTNFSFIEKLENDFDLVGIINNDSYIYLLEKINFTMLFILNLNNKSILKLLNFYINLIENIKNSKYKYIIYMNTKIIVNDNLIIDRIITKIIDTKIELIYTNNIELFFVCKKDVFYSMLENDNIVSYIKINENILNSE